jgi:hypothetical protein
MSRFNDNARVQSASNSKRKGTVQSTDDLGNVSVSWDDGTESIVFESDLQAASK